MPKKQRRRVAKTPDALESLATDVAPRIIGGRLRGRKLQYSGMACTRPMKHRVREAVFNLVGPDVRGRHVIDLFAGTGAMGLEALSRGGASASFVERHFPTADIIHENIRQFGLEDVCEVCPSSVTMWLHRLDQSAHEKPWVVFFCPPYDLYQDQTEEVIGWIEQVLHHAPAGSTFVVEADTRFDFDQLPQPELWDVRAYPPAVVGIRRLPDASAGCADNSNREPTEKG